MSTLPKFMASTKLYGSSIYNGIRSRIFSSRTSTSNKRETGTGSTEEDMYKKSYMQLKAGSASADGVSSSDTIPLRGITVKEEVFVGHCKAVG
jgi:hypothetical protein